MALIYIFNEQFDTPSQHRTPGARHSKRRLPEKQGLIEARPGQRGSDAKQDPPSEDAAGARKRGHQQAPQPHARGRAAEDRIQQTTPPRTCPSIQKKKDHAAINGEISSLRARNHSYREMHKHEMNNILKALYLVKLDDARQIKNSSLENRKSLEKAQESKQEQQRERRLHFQEQSEQAKKRYLEYWKNKLASVYESSHRKEEEALAIA
jgi:hypothetical protein